MVQASEHSEQNDTIKNLYPVKKLHNTALKIQVKNTTTGSCTHTLAHAPGQLLETTVLIESRSSRRLGLRIETVLIESRFNLPLRTLNWDGIDWIKIEFPLWSYWGVVWVRFYQPRLACSIHMKRSGPGPVQVRPQGPVHSPSRPGPTICVQVRLHLDLDPDIWGPVRTGPGSARSRTGLWTVYVESENHWSLQADRNWERFKNTFLLPTIGNDDDAVWSPEW